MDEQEPIYARALDEVACAFNIPLNSAVEVVKAVYGLGNAPRSWWLSVVATSCAREGTTLSSTMRGLH